MEQIITHFDFSVLDFIYQYIRCDFLDPIMRYVSYFANSGIGWIILGGILCVPKKTRTFGMMALFAMLIGFVCNDLIIKNIVQRVRPYDDYELYHSTALPFILNAGTESSFSFASGHTCCSFSSAVVYFCGNKKWGTVALAFAALIGFSRLYNYVHYFTDVIFGAIIGTLCALLIVYIFKKFKFYDRINKVQSKQEV